MMKVTTNVDVGKRLPDGWRWVRLGELAIYWNGRAFKPEEWKNQGMPIIRIENLNSSEATFNYFEGEVFPQHKINNGDLLVSWSASLDAYIWNRGPAVLNQHIFKVEIKNQLIMQDFFYFVLRYMMRQIRELVHGATMQHITKPKFERIEIPLPPISEQKRIAAIIKEQMAAVDKARVAAQARLEAVKSLPAAFIRESLNNKKAVKFSLENCLIEIKNGIGKDWQDLSVLGATRDGLAPAKDPVGKSPERYKLVDPVTVFYNPMRILLGSIAMVDEDDTTGITSPDYVVVKGRSGILDTRWFYYWFRSVEGARMIDSLSRGAVRERILFKRLTKGTIELPDFESQLQVSEKLRRIKPMLKRLSEELETIQALPQALVRRVFNGEL